MLEDGDFFAMAELVAKRSTCPRLAVGALLVQENRIISSGYNGTASGLPHCDHTEGQPCSAVHAEVNTIASAAKKGIPTQGSTLYSTHMPCRDCAGAIINSGVQMVKYQGPYKNELGVADLSAAGLLVVGCVLP